jgi:uncharacterized membrane protein YkvA (DUF1232 family)
VPRSTSPYEPLEAFDEEPTPSRRGPRTGMKRSVMRIIRQFPSYLRLLVGLIGDRRVSRIDRLFVVAALAYIVSPLDVIPDLIPFLGQVDDVFLLLTALERLVERAGPQVLRDHWRGTPADLEALDMPRVLEAAAFFLPGWMRRTLRRVAGRRRRGEPTPGRHAEPPSDGRLAGRA